MTNLKVSALFVLLLIGSCSQPITPPVETDNTPPGKRNYTWSIDSINAPDAFSDMFFESMWGSSPTDVWAAGYTTSPRDCLWHYNGVCWKRAAEGTPILGSNGVAGGTVGRVWGTAQNDVWAIGGRISLVGQTQLVSTPFVIHYDGVKWAEVLGDTSQMPKGCQDIYGVGKNDFWVVNYQAVTHYKNGVWKKYPVRDSLLVWRVLVSDKDVYATAIKFEETSNYSVLLRLKQGKFEIIDSTGYYGNEIAKFGVSAFEKIGNRLYSASDQLSSAALLSNADIDTASWKAEAVSIPSGNGFANSFRQSNKNIFFHGAYNNLYHYNGTDWQRLVIPDSLSVANGRYIGVWADSSQIIVCDDFNYTIYRGR